MKVHRWVTSSLETKRGLFCALAIALLIWAAAAPCGAVIILEKGSDEPIRGYLVSENELRVIVNELLPGGQTKHRILPRSSIDEIIISVDRERLASLSCDDPRGYRDYAEELSAKRKDPDARVTAIRLYLIAAYLDPDELGRGSLLGMAALARSPGEERRFRAMVYLLDPDHNRSALKAPAAAPAASSALDDTQREMLLQGLAALRGGRKREALNLARRPAFQQLFNHSADLVSLDDFTAAARDTDAFLPPRMLKRVLALELRLRNATLPADDPELAARPWSQIPADAFNQTVVSLDLATLTEFNPRQCVFRDGAWVEP